MERILAISTLFPTIEMPSHGLFVFKRLEAMAAQTNVEVTVCNPVPTSFIHRLMPRYKAQQSVSFQRRSGGMDIFCPRYKTIPGFKKDQEHESLIEDVMPYLLKLHEKRDFTRIDVHWTYPDLPLAIKLAKQWGIPCTLTLRGMEAFYLADKDRRSNIILNHISKVDNLISLSQEMLDFANKHSKFVGGSIVSNGTDTSKFGYINQRVARAMVCPQLLDSDLILGVGATIERKGFHHVIDAICELNTTVRKENPIRYYIIGGPGMEGNFESVLRKKIKHYINLTGRRDDIVLFGMESNQLLPFWYNAATLFCLSSFGEGSPNVLTEAMTCGCPAITTNVGAAPDILARYPESGYVIPNQKDMTDEQARKTWAAAILSALENKPAAPTRALQARFVKRFTWEWCGLSALEVSAQTYTEIP
ncbi:glycosyltransferase [Alteromonas sp. 14N.309.X.WAT.G.H12]|uniref:glycosyltransferase n=1 Tax=Alteromonas sp. 14N.309.X.WAT.G.H12 TaxID=3120824 RepID=UPI002FD5F372